jgi:hypothetical protein
VAEIADCGERCAPPTGSRIIESMISMKMRQKALRQLDVDMRMKYGVPVEQEVIE